MLKNITEGSDNSLIEEFSSEDFHPSSVVIRKFDRQ